MNTLSLIVLPRTYAVCQFQPDEPIPDQIFAADFWSITRTVNEISIVLPEHMVSTAWKASLSWRCLMVEGPLDFSLIGILAGLSATLADAGVSLFAISTYNTDYLLVRSNDFEKAKAALMSQGYRLNE
jgi:uncharacterized protein